MSKLRYMAQTGVSPENLLVHIASLLRSAPHTLSSNYWDSDPSEDEISWAGRASATLKHWDGALAGVINAVVSDYLEPEELWIKAQARRRLLSILSEAQHDLILKTDAPTSIAVEKGRIFDYFSEIVNKVEEASSDLLFVDPYIDVDFVGRYLPHAKSGVVLRLMTAPGKTPQKLQQLAPAVKLFASQSGQTVQLRTSAGLHDRYLFLDGRRCFSSGASFKDGAKNSGTTILEIIDVFASKIFSEVRVNLSSP